MSQVQLVQCTNTVVQLIWNTFKLDIVPIVPV